MSFDAKSFKGFKKIDADKHFTTFQHPDGHIIRIAHKGVDKDNRQELRFLKMYRGGSVPGYADGGDVPKKEGSAPYNIDYKVLDAMHSTAPYEPTQATFPPPEVLPDSVMANLPLPEPTRGPQQASLGPTNYQLQQPQADQAAPQDPYGIQAQETATMGGLQQQKQGLLGQASAQAQQGNAQAKVQQDAAAQMAQMQKDYEGHFTQLNKEREILQSEIHSKAVDPNHFWASKSVPGKISAALGVIISGLGGASENSAMKFINSEIDRDIKSQEANLGKTQNLLDANMKQFGNLKDAQTATRAMLLDVTAAKLGEAAAKAQSPMAKAQAQQAIGKLNQDSAALLGQIAARKALMGGGQGMAQANPAYAVRFLVPEHDQKEATKELGESQEATKAVQATMKAFNEIKSLQTAKSRIGSPIQSSSQIDALKGPITAQLSKATAGRFTETDAHFLDKLWPGPLDDQNTVNKKMQAMQRLLEEKFNYPTLQKYGLSPKFPKAPTPIANAPAKFGK
jgi:hypothetical protein